MAEAILRHVGSDKFMAHSAGSDPAGFVHPLVEPALARLGIPLREDARSKSWDEFQNHPMELVITVCDNAESQCPAWVDQTLKVHWPLPDPSFLPGTDEDRLEFAVRLAERLRLKLQRLTKLDLTTSDRAALREQLDFIGQL
jgi:arsenate reductase